MLTENKFSKYLIYAIGEIALVMIGILLALQVNNWNENRKTQIEERDILQRLQLDLRDDLKNLQFSIDFKKDIAESYGLCLEILSEETIATKEEFMTHFSSILEIQQTNLNMTTFKNLQTTGQIRLIKSNEIADNIVSYYNSDYKNWESALKDYTRNITAPYILQFDYLPQKTYTDNYGNNLKMTGQPKDFKKPEKTIDDYKNNYFIINTLRQKKYNIEALIPRYKQLINNALELDKTIQEYLDTQQ